MYLPSRRRRRRSNPGRVLFLLLLVGAALYAYSRIRPQEDAATVLPLSTPTPTRSPQSYQLEAEGLYWDGDLRGAIAAYEQAIRLAPSDGALHAALVRLLVLDGRPLEAVRYGEQAVAVDPNSASAWAALCLAYDWVGMVDDALEACDRAIVLNPADAMAYAYQAEAHMDSGQWNKGLESAETALKLDPRSVDALRAHGYVLEMIGNYSGAIEEYQKALEIHPKLAHLYLDVGRNRQALVDTPGAIAAFRKAVELAPYRADALDWLGWAYYAIEEYIEARRYLEQAIQADPEYAPAYGHMATVYWSQRNYESAIPNFERAIEMAYRASRRSTRALYVTLEPAQTEYRYPTLARKILEGRVRPTDMAMVHLTALLTPTEPSGAWAEARGQLTLNAVTGEATVLLEDMHPPPAGEVYVGWFSGLRTLGNSLMNTGPLPPPSGGQITVTLRLEKVRGPRIEYYYTLGLCYFYMAECERAYPLFEAALRIDPQDPNALEGIRLCREAESTTTRTP